MAQRSRVQCTRRSMELEHCICIFTHHPTQRRNVPRQTSGAEWAPKRSVSTTLPLASNRPFLGPRIAAPINPDAPPTKCTTRQPAKSTTPTPKSGSSLKADSQPCGAQILCSSQIPVCVTSTCSGVTPFTCKVKRRTARTIIASLTSSLDVLTSEQQLGTGTQ